MGFTGYIYLITNKVNNKQYVGKTLSTIQKRWNGHCNCAMRGKCNKFYSAIRKYGKDSFTWTCLGMHNALTKKELNEILSSEEIRLIAKFNTFKEGYNSTAGGEGSINCVPWNKNKKGMYTSTEETKQKQRLSHLGLKHKPMSEEGRKNISKYHADFSGRKHPYYGKKMSKEEKEKNRKFHIGLYHTEETKKKMSLAHMGLKHKPMSEEGRKNISLAKKGKSILQKGHKVSMETREKLRLATTKYWNNKKKQIGAL
jgi:group I intron endonuclease